MNQGISKALRALLEQAFDHFDNGAFEEAVNTFTASLLIAPDHAGARRGRAQAYFRLKVWDAAESDFQLARNLEVKRTT